MLKRSFGFVVVALTSTVLICGWSAAREYSGCGATGKIMAPADEKISCTGTCNTGGNACRPQNGSNSTGSYKYCGCLNGGGETGCCHLILYTSGAEEDNYSTEGNCDIDLAGCDNDSQQCKRSGDGTELNKYEAICVVVTPPL